MIIAIDGPAGAGKSTIAREVAQELKFAFVDTGAMYRAVTWKALQNGVNPEDEASLGRLAERSTIDLRDSQIFIDDQNVSEEIRLPDVDKAVSIVSRAKKVREHLVSKQRLLARTSRDIVVEGRDIGSVVFPSAEVKVFLTARVEERARRRMKQLKEKGLEKEAQAVESEIQARDQLDSGRVLSPLEKAADAHMIDTTDKSISEVVNLIIGLIGR